MSGRRLRALRALASVVLGAASILCSGAAPNAAQQSPEIPAPVREHAARGGHARVIVELKLPSPHAPEGTLGAEAVASQRRHIAAAATRVLADLSGNTHRVVHRFRTIPYIALDVSPAALAALEAAGDDVVRVFDDEIVRPILAESVPLVQGDQAWDAGYDGGGTAVAVLDTGVDAAHPLLAGKVIEEACFSSTVAGTSRSVCPNGLDEQFGPGAAVPCALSDCSHGTHVAGIAAGNGTSSGQPYSGVAKGARIVAVQVFSRLVNPISCGGAAECAGAFSSDIIAGLEYVYSLAAQHEIAAANLSLGGNLFAAPCDSQPYKPIIDNLRSIRVATIVASGNSGSTSQISSPACISSAVSVGATTKSDSVAWFSNVSPYLSLLAPGDSIVSSVPHGGYAAFSGTSMAAPHVAGTWSVIRQASPAADVASVLDALRSTGTPISDTRLFGTVTAPRINVLEALAVLTPIASPAPEISSISPSRARAGAGVSLTVTGSGFNALTVVEWNGTPQPTVTGDSSHLVASIPASELAAAGTASVTAFTPAPGGGRTASLTFTIDPPATLTPSATRVAPGASVTVTLAAGYGGTTDWLALAATGAPDTSYLQWTYIGAGITDRTWTVKMPGTAGTYEFRLFASNVRAATSAPVTVDPSLPPPPPAINVSATTVVGGDSITATLVDGPGGAGDWLALSPATAPDTTYVQYVYVGTGVTTRTWIVKAPTAAGTYQFRLFVNNSYTRVATSADVTVLPGPPILTSISPAGALPGSAAFSLTANGSGFTAASIVEWNGAPRSTTFVSATQLRAAIAAADVAAAGTARVTVRTPAGIGGGTSSSLPFTIGSPTLAVSTTSVSGGASVTVTLSNGLGGSTDWLALATTTAANTSYVQYTYVGSGITSRTWTVSMPATPGTYEFRLFLNNGYSRAATSAAVTVLPAANPPVLAVSATQVKPGASVTVTLTDGYGGSTDWLALAAITAPNTSNIQYTYVGNGVTTRTWTVTMPAAAGTYEFRLFLNNTYTRGATSPPVTVAP